MAASLDAIGRAGDYAPETAACTGQGRFQHAVAGEGL